ncbi:MULTISPECIES: RNA 2',3'-cyclic phosphodiesterase [Pseudomonas]|jgi:2'-5' RNA ligase|uniref:RNA 2',3'-cyclic phosphodiesterase n=1 Tax=Pseudomonas kielensis TaxID=2762577 RepID=A0A7X1GCY3_9PSED|nr:MULTISPECIES: RNA 2',3'-cyclic phosphodiesterase [Pseudomonas]MBC2690150.1 RNA 2',3'-cyclic phosphodiesterase [Pseudomonas kielensis]NBB36446.1 RNA 2',3'-cyclic phosphodiesterase [Pseudomonas sp. BC115LW]UZM14722.1 RNA 2',3'-cyclic phosphodiesterase [Pseudomonas kielensis]WKL53203.1 RNA 2',3'-cyclic phosphodiesterase [Pseudomonas kielensis]
MHKQPDLPSKRLFFALPCEPAQRRAIAQWRNTLGHLEGRPIAGENFHLTLMFLGEVAVSELPGIYAAAARVCVPGEPLRIRLDQLQAWHRAGMLVLVPGAPAPALLQRVYALHQAMLALGFADVPREYRAHLSLVRDFHAPVPEADIAPDFTLDARRVVLFESHKGRYRALAQWPLEP